MEFCVVAQITSPKPSSPRATFLSTAHPASTGKNDGVQQCGLQCHVGPGSSPAGELRLVLIRVFGLAGGRGQVLGTHPISLSHPVHSHVTHCCRQCSFKSCVSQGWGRSSVGKVLALKTQGAGFTPQNVHFKNPGLVMLVMAAPDRRGKCAPGFAGQPGEL